MGTNYYLNINNCKCCHRTDRMHVGKSFKGWKFTFYPNEQHQTANDWITAILDPNNILTDEYGYELNPHEFIESIKNMQNSKQVSIKYGGWSDGEYNYAPNKFC